MPQIWDGVIKVNLLKMSFSGTVFIVAVMMIRAAAIQHLPKKTFLVLWEIVLLRLMIPFTIPSIFSVHTLINRSISMPSFLERETDAVSSAVSQKHVIIVQNMERLPADSASASVWFLVWGVGMVLLAAFFAVSYLRFRMEFQTALPVDNVYADQWLKERPLKRHISIRQSGRILAPLTYGVFRPVILMPKKTDWENVSQLSYILSHEYVHICRFDAFTKLLAAVALCIHWFNPFVWIMYIFFNRDMELACDESVIRQFGEKSKSAYALMLIRMEERRSGVLPFCSNFSRNAIEERITAIMNTKRTTFAAYMSAGLVVFAIVSLFATSEAAADGSHNGKPAVSALQTNEKVTAADKSGSVSIIHESADILYYDHGCPYIHDILTNHTDKTITQTQYCMLAYNEKGEPLKLYWNFLDSSAESSFANIVQSEENILPGQTEDDRGGWSLYDGEIMDNFLKVGDGGANQTAYALLCLKQVVFEDGTTWNNPDYESWFKTYAGEEIRIEELQNYYPYEYHIENSL